MLCLSRQCYTAEADFLSWCSIVESKVIIATYSNVSVERYVTKMFSMFFTHLVLAA